MHAIRALQAAIHSLLPPGVTWSHICNSRKSFLWTHQQHAVPIGSALEKSLDMSIAGSGLHHQGCPQLLHSCNLPLPHGSVSTAPKREPPGMCPTDPSCNPTAIIHPLHSACDFTRIQRLCGGFFDSCSSTRRFTHIASSLRGGLSHTNPSAMGWRSLSSNVGRAPSKSGTSEVRTPFRFSAHSEPTPVLQFRFVIIS